MKHARPLALCALLLLGPVQAPPAQDRPAQPILRLADGSAMVEMDLDQVLIEDFIRAAQPLLELPVHYEPAELMNMRITQPGVQRVPRALLRDAFDSVLRRFDLWTWDDISSGTTVITIYRPSPGRGHSFLPFTPKLVTIEQLQAGPSPRLPIYTVNFPLQHAVARDQLNTLQPLLDTSMEIVRPSDAPNALIVSASREHLLAVRDLLAAVDVPGTEPEGTSERLEKLEKRLADLESRLAKLEAPAR